MARPGIESSFVAGPGAFSRKFKTENQEDTTDYGRGSSR